jgi:hypothetical protein
MDMISVLEEKFVLVVEAKKSSIGEAMKQCLLSLKDMRDGNGGGTVYGFTITGTIWRTFQTTNEILALSDLMGEGGGGKWMKNSSVSPPGTRLQTFCTMPPSLNAKKNAIHQNRTIFHPSPPPSPIKSNNASISFVV